MQTVSLVNRAIGNVLSACQKAQNSSEHLALKHGLRSLRSAKSHLLIADELNARLALRLAKIHLRVAITLRTA